MNVDRRQFLKTAGCVGLSAATINLVARRAAASGGSPTSGDAMGVLVDLTKCNG